MPTFSADTEALAKEISRIHESVAWSAQIQFEQLKLWRAMNMLLGVPAAVLAAISGGTGLTHPEAATVPAILALLAAGFGAAVTTLNPSRRVAQAQAAANACLEIQTAARQLLLVDLATSSRDEARDKLSELTVRRDEVNRTADPPGRYAYWRATRNFTKGRQSYEADSRVQ
ncbi:SLATT domain-containing protein [Mycolicibacterium grossiae]|uniref:SLATT domain-containing protein n=1 Tax=Mycolicibacterium grossiae TaxID=1552759 RepID=UPI0009F28AD8|nr:SLATT domain-containing protein [Mycolicibacterium grossiae]QEM43579.1 SLATT domain-containing protein [Mycolicibacterium grossiae]